VLVPPKQTVEADFDTNNPGRWISHCHNTYHLAPNRATPMRTEFEDEVLTMH
jgi:FtsP/CotA-like multicopper oxidase with cupredoxin domain